jgi:DNA-binding beta-propeller fold protein YncE
LPDSGERSPEERRRRRKLIALVLLVALLLALALIIAWYLLTRKPLSSMPPLVKDKPHYAFSIYGVTAPLGVAASADGERVYVTQSGGTHDVQVFDRSGKKVGALTPPEDTGKIHVPVYVAVDPVTRSVYVSDRATATIYIYDSGGRFQGKVTPKDKEKVGAWAPLGLAFDRDGKLYVTDVGTPPHRVLVFARDGTLEKEFKPAEPGQLTFPNGITVDSQGRVQVADSNNGRVVVFDQTGKVLANLAGSYGGVTLGLPRGLALDEDQKLYLVDTTNHQVRIFRLENGGDTVATYLGSFGEEGTADGFFEYPNGVACDSRARIYVTDRVNNRVQVWSY